MFKKDYDTYWPFTDDAEPALKKFRYDHLDESALKASIVMKSDVLLNDKRFLLGFLPGCPQVWSNLPEKYQKDPDLVAALPLNTVLAIDVFRRIPALKGDADFWLSLLRRNSLNSSRVTALAVLKLVRDWAPTEIRSHHTVMFNATQATPQVLQFVDQSLWLDPSFVVDIFEEIPEARATLVQAMPKTVQCTWRCLMVDAAEHPTTGSQFDWLRRKKNISMAVCSLVPELWRDRDFVLSRLRHLDWKTLQQGEEPLFLHEIRHACRFISSDKELMLLAVKTNRWAYLILSDILQEDASLIVAFLNKGRSKSMITYVPEGVFGNKAAITMILPNLTQPENLWDKMPSTLKSDVELAGLIPCVTRNGIYEKIGDSWVDNVLRSCQGIRGDEGFWLVFMSGVYRRKIWHYFKNWATPNILASHKVMIAAAGIDSTVLRMVDPSVWNDQSFVEQVAFTLPAINAFRIVPNDSPFHCCELALRVLERYHAYHEHHHTSQLIEFDLERFPDDDQAMSLPVNFWDDRKSVLAWFRAGGPFIDELFPVEWKNDKEIFLLMAKWYRHSRFTSHLLSMCPSFTADKKIMLAAAEMNNDIYDIASREVLET